MFSRAASFTVLALPLLATAIAFPGGGPPTPPPPTSSCSAGAGSLTCCNSSQSANNLSLLVIGLLHTLGISIGGLEGLVGVTCSAAVGGSCSQQTLCCTNNTFNGLVAIGCTNINI